MGKTRIIAETGAGQHGVDTATVAALFNLPCTIFMVALDVERQQPNVFLMNLLVTEVRAVAVGACTLKDALNTAFRDCVSIVLGLSWSCERYVNVVCTSWCVVSV